MADTRKTPLNRSPELTNIPLRWSRRQLLAATRPEGNGLFLYFETLAPPAVTTSTCLRLEVTDTGEFLDIVGTVHSHRLLPLSGAMTGVELLFGGEAKRSLAMLVARCAGKPPEVGTARCPRLGKNLDCSLKLGSKTLPGFVRDLSASGAFIAAPSLTRVRVGAEVKVKLPGMLFGLGAPTLNAKVVWFGLKDGALGFGARFVDEPSVVGMALKRHLAA
jgi:hypothetical protein